MGCVRSIIWLKADDYRRVGGFRSKTDDQRRVGSVRSKTDD